MVIYNVVPDTFRGINNRDIGDYHCNGGFSPINECYFCGFGGHGPILVNGYWNKYWNGYSGAARFCPCGIPQACSDE